MEKMKWFIIVPVLLLASICSWVNSSEDDHVCNETRTYNITKRIKYQEPFTTVSYEWCFKYPPKCTVTQKVMRNKSKVETEMRTEIVKVCCPGFALKNLECVAVCPPGVTGKTCNETCQFGFWGKSCHKKCSCPKNALCDVTDGKCICRPGFVGQECSEPEEIFTTEKKNLFDWSIPSSQSSKNYDFILENVIFQETTTVATDILTTTLSVQDFTPDINSNETDTTEKSRIITIKNIMSNNKSTIDESIIEKADDVTNQASSNIFSPVTTVAYFNTITPINMRPTTVKDSKIIYIKNKIWGPEQKNTSNTDTKLLDNSKHLMEDNLYFIKPKVSNISIATMPTLGTSVKPTTATLQIDIKDEITIKSTSTDDSFFIRVIDKPNTETEVDSSTIPDGLFTNPKFNLPENIQITLPSVTNTTTNPIISDKQLPFKPHTFRDINNNTFSNNTVLKSNRNKSYVGFTSTPVNNKNQIKLIELTTVQNIFPWSTTISSFDTTNIEYTNTTTEDLSNLEETHQTLTEPEHITSVAGEKRSDTNKDDYISIVSTATGVAIAVILVAIVIVFIERYRRRRNDRDKQIGMKNIKSMMCDDDDGTSTYIRSIFHNPLPDPPCSSISTKTEPNSPFYRPVVIHAISPVMIENYRGILESHYDHLPSRDPRLATFQPISCLQSSQNSELSTTLAPSPIDNVHFRTFIEPSHYDPLHGPAIKFPVPDNSEITIEEDNFNSSYNNEYSNEPLYDEIPILQPAALNISANAEALTEL